MSRVKYLYVHARERVAPAKVYNNVILDIYLLISNQYRIRCIIEDVIANFSAKLKFKDDNRSSIYFETNSYVMRPKIFYTPR